MTSQLPLPPVKLLFDTSAILASQVKQWQLFSGLGKCVLPQIVADEIRFLSSRAPEPAQEVAARSFARFFPNSGWSLFTRLASQPPSNLAAGMAMSKQARQTLAVAQSACALAKDNPGHLVVAVADNPHLFQHLQSLQLSNLCCAPLSVVVQWGRTGYPPPAVRKGAAAMQVPGASFARVSPPAVPVRPRVLVPERPAISSRPRSATTRNLTEISRQGRSALSTILSLALAVVLGLVGFRLLAPKQFNQFWQKTGLPALPGR